MAWDDTIDTFALLEVAVQPIKNSITALVNSEYVYITFLHYEKDKNTFNRVDFVNPNPLYDLHRKLLRDEGGFVYAFDAFDNGRPAVAYDVRGDNCPWSQELKRTAEEARIRSLISVPLEVVAGSKVGVINTFYADPLERGSDQTDRLLANSCMIAVAVAKLMETQLLRAELAGVEMAEQIQNHLLPPYGMELSCFRVDGKCKSADRVGGDHYDYFAVSDRILGFTLADAMSHGIEAALPIMAYSALWRATVSAGQDLKSAAETIHKVLQGFLSDWFDVNVSAFLGLVSSEDHSLSYINAGQDPAYLFRYRSRKCVPLKSDFCKLGTNPTPGDESPVVPPPRKTILLPGDMVVLLSDGFWECRERPQDTYVAQTIRSSIREACDRTPQLIIEKVFRTVEKISGDMRQGDDRTALIIKREHSG